MTHGDIYIPLNGKILYCEAWSDGYIDGVGFGALCSSHHIEEISKLSSIFYGSPFFYDVTTAQFVAKEEDYLIEGYYDMIDESKGFDTNMVESAQETLELILKGDLSSAYLTDFAKMPLKNKIDIGLGMNADLSNEKKAWNGFMNGSSVLPLEEICELLANNLKKDDTFKPNARYKYFWKDEQFFVNIYIDKNIYLVPLMIACALICDDSTVYGSIEYLRDMTKKDKDALLVLNEIFNKNGLDHKHIFGGHAKKYIDAYKLNAKLNDDLNNDANESTIKTNKKIIIQSKI
jgi:hypothetical protein